MVEDVVVILVAEYEATISVSAIYPCTAGHTEVVDISVPIATPNSRVIKMQLPSLTKWEVTPLIVSDNYGPKTQR
jgi:hypothetical protein